METDMKDRIEKIVETQAELWSGIAPPNEAGRLMAAQLAAVVKGFEDLRGTLHFEDEPSSFEAALQATKDRE